MWQNQCTDETYFDNISQWHLTIFTEVIVTSLEIKSGTSGLQATGVFLERDSQSHGSTDRYYVRARREIILCAGAIGSPQLLMLRCETANS